MHLYIFIPTVFFAVYLVMMLVSSSVDFKDYKYYKPTYEALKSGEFVIVHKGFGGDMWYFKKRGDSILNESEEILFFFERGCKVNSIKLLSDDNDNHYIHNLVPLIFENPYKVYWRRKIIKQMQSMNSSVYEDEMDGLIRDLFIPTQNLTRTKVVEHFKFLR